MMSGLAGWPPRLIGLPGLVLAAVLGCMACRGREAAVDPYASVPRQPGELRRLGLPNRERFRCLALSADGRRLLTGSDGLMRLWDIETGAEARRFAAAEGRLAAVQDVGLSSDGRRAFSVANDDTVRLWDTESGEELRRFVGEKDSVGFGTLSADGRRALFTHAPGSVWFWDVANWKEIKRLPQDAPILSMAIAADDRRALMGGEQRPGQRLGLRLWDLQTGRVLMDFAGEQGTVRSVAISSDGRRALSGGDDRTVRLWDAETGREVLRMEHDGKPGQSVFCVAMTPDARFALSGGDDMTMRLWDLQSGRELLRFSTGRYVWCVAISSDGRRAVAGVGDQALVLDLADWLPTKK